MKEILKPLEVPWQVASSTPQLKLTASEDKDTIIGFIGFFATEKSVGGDTQQLPNKKIRIVEQDVAFDNTKKTGQYQLINVVFKGGEWVKLLPPFSEREIIQESAYDWQMVDGRFKKGESIPLWIKRFHQQWETTRICPDPNAFEVINSQWLKETKAFKWDCKHYLFVGERSYIEVLAKDYSWDSMGQVLW